MPEGHPDNHNHLGDDATKSSAALRAKLARQLDQPTFKPLEPPPVPDHTLIRCIGEGACGEVWLARNALGTLRAVKIVYRARFKEDRPYEREFDGILKYEPFSRTHEGLVHVLHVGRNDEVQCFYYVMELADPEGSTRGSEPSSEIALPSVEDYRPRTLRSEQARRGRLPTIESAQIALRLVGALAHLHDSGLIHRDIKPSNVIFVSGQPKLADIGLVTDIGSSRSFVGTEGFIPPEGPGTLQADLYALGKLLYELASGRDRMEFPDLPAGIGSLPDGIAFLELNEVITRACAPEPASRYVTATEFQAELNLFLAGRSLRRAHNIERYLERSKRIAVVACILLVFAAAALWFSEREKHQAEERARSEALLRKRAEVAERQGQYRLYKALLEQARATVRSGELGQRRLALTAIREAAAISNSVELRREALSALALPDLHFESELAAGPEFVVKTLDPKFERIALSRLHGDMEIRAVLDNRLLATLPASTNLSCYGVTWSQDGRFLCLKRDYQSKPGFGDLEVWNVNEGRRILLIHDARFHPRAFHPYKSQLLVAGANGLMTLWDLETGKEIARSNFEATPELLAYSPDGTRIAASYRLTNEWGISIHNAIDGALLVKNVITNTIAALEWHPHGRWVATADYGGLIHLLDPDIGQLRLLGRHKAESATAVFSPNGDYLLTGGWERELICWDMHTMQRALTIGLDSYVAQFRADGQVCALVTLAGVQLHTFEYPTAHRRFVELGSRLRHAAFSPDGKSVAAAADYRVGVWDLTGDATGALVPGGSETLLFWTPDGQELLGCSPGENTFRWRVEPATNSSASPVLRQQQFDPPEGFASLNLIANQLLWTTATGSSIFDLEDTRVEAGRYRETIPGLSRISPDQRWLAMHRPYGSVLYVYRLPEITLVTRLTNQAAIAGVSFSPNGDEVLVGSRGQVEFWSTETWERTRVATNFIGILDHGGIFQPDGKSVWLAKDYRDTGLYHTRTMVPALFLPHGMFPLALSTDGQQLAVSVDAQRLAVWDLVAVREQFRALGLDWTER